MSLSTLSSQGVDPSAPGTIIRAALAFESLLTIGIGSYLIFFPRHYLLRAMGAAAAQGTTAALQMTQHFGAANLFTGAIVALFVPNTRKAVELRPILYYAFLAFELGFIHLLLWQAYMMEGGMLRQSLLAEVIQLVPFVGWRIFVLGWKPEWLGRYLTGTKKE